MRLIMSVISIISHAMRLKEMYSKPITWFLLLGKFRLCNGYNNDKPPY